MSKIKIGLGLWQIENIESDENNNNLFKKRLEKIENSITNRKAENQNTINAFSMSTLVFLRSILELFIEKGIITKDEYLKALQKNRIQINLENKNDSEIYEEIFKIHEEHFKYLSE